ncbi:tRNA uridine-5-carboxymethylaminomethyl(34) synthesis GTPase MnmE [Allorhizobium sonneratiae]|uniref:tRNA uridine-5-carboxymethylaminomethyl(34) synthesis GTPase MnmE n=1 Tax=Allorhizobium sonneratiae TaxID=2934936 RepID=UPI003B848132
MDNRTIFALSTGSLPSGVAVIRLSGPRMETVVAKLCGSLPKPRQASLRTIHLSNGQVLDSGLVIVFPGPASFTGEDCAEFHVHGSRAVVSALLDELASFPECRLAEAGEFSRRAFENGKLDLIEIEGLADLLAAETEMQRRQAIEQASGHASALYDGWRKSLLHARAMIEAELDFADESDVPGSVSNQIWQEVDKLRQSLQQSLAGEKSGEIIRDGFKVVIAGAPNAGKSSLMNGLARRDIAIVTNIAGTTRDVLHCDLDLEGYAVRLYDTAGLRETDEIVEREGIRRALKTVEEADLVLYLQDMTGGDFSSALSHETAPVLKIGTKKDLVPGKSDEAYSLTICTSNDADLDEVRSLLLLELRKRLDLSASVIPSRLRQRECLRHALGHLEASMQAHLPLEIRADELRAAADHLSRLIGRIDTEMLLGKIFSEFCIGK